ncbi:MAG: tyrosine-type recombinase/integrase [Patescibacteria group bacterium]
MSDFICPFCDSDKFYKNGFNRGKQRYKCFECKRYTYSHYSIDCHVEKTVKPKSPIRKARLISSTLKDKPVIPFRFESDLWDVRALRAIEKNEKVITINFVQINYDWLKKIVKQYLKQELLSGDAVSTTTKKIVQLRLFCSYIENQTNVQHIDQISREIILDFLCTFCQSRGSNYTQHILGTLRDFFHQGNLHGWFKVPEHLIRDEDYPKWKKGKPKDIPTKVLEQIENNLHQLPNPIARMWMVGFFCAMRISELQLCSLDCLKQDSRGRWFITFYRQKNKDYHTLPVSRESAQIIQQQQEYIRKQFGSSFDYLFCHYVGFSKDDVNQSNFIPVEKFVDDDILSRCVNCLIKAENIRDDNGKLWHFTNRQLRDTRLTYLFETGHEFTVVSKWAGHKKYETTQKYVHVKDHTLREETASIQAALLNIRGESLNPKDLPETLQNNPNAHTLAITDDHINTPIYGYCGLSLDQDCPHWKACYTCPSFVARRELLPDYIKVRNLLREKQTRAENKGETALIDQFKQQADSLDTVIASFERVG